MLDSDERLFEKMPWARFGVYVTHASILIIFLGAIIGNLFGVTRRREVRQDLLILVTPHILNIPTMSDQ